MKRTLLFITAVLAALTVFFAACQDPVTNPTSLKTSEEISAISGPEWVKATAYRGAIFVSWAFNKDAESYSVYRQRTDGLDKLTHLETPNGLYVLDIVSPTNQLVDGVEYTYYVTANSGQGITERAVIDKTIILDGAAQATVTAKIPARYNDAGTWQDVTALLEADQTLDAAAVKEEKVVDGNTEKLLLTWPHYNPAFKYTVSYDIGTALTLNTVSSDYPNPNSTAGLGTSAFWGAPLFGGTNTARISVKWNGDVYYYKPVEITKPLAEYSLNRLNIPGGFTVSRDNVTSATLKWPISADAPKAADYKVYRIEAKGITTGPYAKGAVEVVGDWTLVTGFSTEGRVDYQDGNGNWYYNLGITLVDTDLSYGKGYIYALYAEVGDAKSAPKLYGLQAGVSIPEPVDYAVTPSYTENSADEKVRTYQVTIGWNASNHAGTT
jgi:hypothetical protein